MARKRASRRANYSGLNTNKIMNMTMDVTKLGIGVSAMSYAFGTTASLLKK